MRPQRSYWCYFIHAQWPRPVAIPGVGPTPCAAKSQALDRLEKYLRESEGMPRAGWKLLRQELVVPR